MSRALQLLLLLPGALGQECTNTCGLFSSDGDCDDGGPGSQFHTCRYGTDCVDCGPRASNTNSGGGGCPSGCAAYSGNAICDGGCNNAACGFDGGDCDGIVSPPSPSPPPPTDYVERRRGGSSFFSVFSIFGLMPFCFIPCFIHSVHRRRHEAAMMQRARPPPDPNGFPPAALAQRPAAVAVAHAVPVDGVQLTEIEMQQLGSAVQGVPVQPGGGVPIAQAIAIPVSGQTQSHQPANNRPFGF